MRQKGVPIRGPGILRSRYEITPVFLAISLRLFMPF